MYRWALSRSIRFGIGLVSACAVAALAGLLGMRWGDAIALGAVSAVPSMLVADVLVRRRRS